MRGGIKVSDWTAGTVGSVCSHTSIGASWGHLRKRKKTHAKADMTKNPVWGSPRKRKKSYAEEAARPLLSGDPKKRFNCKGALYCEIHSVRCPDRLQMPADFRLMRNAVHQARRRMGELR